MDFFRAKGVKIAEDMVKSIVSSFVGQLIKKEGIVMKKMLIVLAMVFSALMCGSVSAVDYEDLSMYQVHYQIRSDYTYAAGEDNMAYYYPPDAYMANGSVSAMIMVDYMYLEEDKDQDISVIYDSFENGYAATEETGATTHSDRMIGDISGREIQATQTISGNEYDVRIVIFVYQDYLYEFSIIQNPELGKDYTADFETLLASVTHDREQTRYEYDNSKVGTDIPAGEYVLYANDGDGYFCVSSDSNQSDILLNGGFEYNAIVTLYDGEYLEMSHCYAVPIEEEPAVDSSGSGMFKVGVHIPAGEYRLEADEEKAYYCVYPDSRQSTIAANNIFEQQDYVTVSDGQYLLLERCRLGELQADTSKVYTDPETVKKVQEALNAAGYDCGLADGIAGRGTQAAIERYQTDNGLSVTGTVTDELLWSLGI